MFSVDILILGAGWTAAFLVPLLNDKQISYASTSRSGRDDTLKFEFDPESHDPAPFETLPIASTVLVTFPIKGLGGSKRLVELYQLSHSNAKAINFIQLGSTGIYIAPGWSDSHSPYDKTNPRAIAEEELLSLSQGNIRTTVLNLSGLWGGERDPRNWVNRVAPTKEALAEKTSLHLIHGIDVARSIIAVNMQFNKAAGLRWLLTDRRVYDWWDLASAWGDDSRREWIGELMKQSGIRALPRSAQVLAKCLDSGEFWSTFGLEPVKARVH